MAQVVADELPCAVGARGVELFLGVEELLFVDRVSAASLATVERS